MNEHGILTKFDINVLAIFLGIVPGLILFLKGYAIRRDRKLIENIPTSTIRAIAIGLVEVKGRAQPLQEVYESPFTGKKCIYLEYEIWEELRAPKGLERTLAQFTSTANQFFLEDETGKVLVDSSQGEFQLQKKEYNAQDNELACALERLKLSRKNPRWEGRPLYGTEASIGLGDELYVMGYADKSSHALDSVEDPSDILIHKKGDSVFCISDQEEMQVTEQLGRRASLFFAIGFLWAVIFSMTILVVWGTCAPPVFNPPQGLFKPEDQHNHSSVVKRKLGFMIDDNKI